MNIINSTRLGSFATQFWNKVKTLNNRNVSNVEYDNNTNIITVTKNDNTSNDMDLSDLKTVWENLEHTGEITFRNLISGLTPVLGAYQSNGNLNSSTTHKSYLIPCEPGRTYKRRNLSGLSNAICNLRGGTDGDTFIRNISWVQVRTKTEWTITIPKDTNITHFTITYNDNLNYGRELMVWDAALEPPADYVQDTAKGGVLLESNVKTKFDALNSGLTSETLDEAIREVATKFYDNIETDSKYLDKSEGGFVSGDVIFKDAYISGGKIQELIHPNPSQRMVNDTSYFVSSVLIVPSNTKISSVTIAVSNNKRIGEVVTGVNIGFLKRSNREVLKYSIQGGTAIVHKNVEPSIPSEKVVTIQLDEIFNEEVLLMIGCNGAKWDSRTYPFGGDVMGGSSLPNIGDILTLTSGNYVGQVVIYSEKIHINSILKGLENKYARLHENNNFTGANRFTSARPTVPTYRNNNGIGVSPSLPVNDKRYYVSLKNEIVAANTPIESIVLPILNGQYRDKVSISIFIVNKDTLEVIEHICDREEVVISNHEHNNSKSVLYPINKTYGYPVVFGFSVEPITTSDNRNLSLMKNSFGAANSCFVSDTIPEVGTQISGNDDVAIACTTANIITDIEVALMTDIAAPFTIGELKTLAYNAGQTTQIGGKTWLKCDGQTVLTADYPELADTMGIKSVDFTLPQPSQTGYLYICAK